MSYEGYTQVLCANGHLRVFDCMDDSWRTYDILGNKQEAKTCSCGAAFVFSHEVDETNFEGQQYPFEEDVPPLFEVCNLGHKHLVREVTYKIPTKKGEQR